jgi:hypothetical protein
VASTWGLSWGGDTGSWLTSWSLALTTIPDVVGDAQAAGTTELQNAGFVVAVREEHSNTVAAGLIISQSPSGGSQALQGSTVTITVSLGERDDGAGSKRRRRRLYVEIDGQPFEVQSAEEARQLLNRARALAERVAETEAKKVEAKVSRAKKPRPIKLKTPTVTASPELEIDLNPFRADLARIYDSQAALAELRVLLQRAIEEEEEESLLLLM